MFLSSQFGPPRQYPLVRMYGTPRVGEPEGPDVEGGAVDGASVGWTVVGDALGTGTVGREVLGSSVGAAVEGAVVGVGVGVGDGLVGAVVVGEEVAGEEVDRVGRGTTNAALWHPGHVADRFQVPGPVANRHLACASCTQVMQRQVGCSSHAVTQLALPANMPAPVSRSSMISPSQAWSTCHPWLRASATAGAADGLPGGGERERWGGCGGVRRGA